MMMLKDKTLLQFGYLITKFSKVDTDQKLVFISINARKMKNRISIDALADVAVYSHRAIVKLVFRKSNY